MSVCLCVRMLERAVEEMRVDVVRRRCRVVEEEVNVLTSSVSSTTDTIQDIKSERGRMWVWWEGMTHVLSFFLADGAGL